nr:LytTR family DNA-binding domain-containing protein [Listeria floridensis]
MSVPLDDILYLSTVPGMRNALLLVTIFGESFIDGKIKDIKAKLDAAHFYTELKSHVIHLRKVKGIDSARGLIQFEGENTLELNTPSIRKVLQHFKEGGNR